MASTTPRDTRSQDPPRGSATVGASYVAAVSSPKGSPVAGNSDRAEVELHRELHHGVGFIDILAAELLAAGILKTLSSPGHNGVILSVAARDIEQTKKHAVWADAEEVIEITAAPSPLNHAGEIGAIQRGEIRSCGFYRECFCLTPEMNIEHRVLALVRGSYTRRKWLPVPCLPKTRFVRPATTGFLERPRGPGMHENNSA